MGAWWSSLEKVSNLNNWALGLAAGFGFFAAVFVIASWFLGSRTSDLQKAQLTQFQTDAETKIAAANQIAAQANEHAKQLEEQTEELRNQNLEIQRRLAPRFLTIPERQSVIKAIQVYKHHSVQITRLGDAEASAYGNSIVEMIQAAGWSVQLNYAGMLAPPLYGIRCRVSIRPDKAVQTLVASLQKIDSSSTVENVNAPDETFVEILVGLKPVI